MLALRRSTPAPAAPGDAGRPRRTALLAAAALLLAAVVLPVALPPSALADGPKSFTADVAATAVPGAAVSADRGVFTVTVTLINTSQGGGGLTLGSANITPPGGVEFIGTDLGMVAGGTLELRSLGVAPGGSATIVVTATAACGIAGGFGVVAKQANNFAGDGNDLTLTGNGHLGVAFVCPNSEAPTPPPVTPTPTPTPTPAPTPPMEAEVLSAQMIQSSDGQVITASGPVGSTGTIDLRFAELDESAIETALFRACEALADAADRQPVRLAPNVFVVDPQGFSAGDEIVVTSTVPVDAVQQNPATYDNAPTGDFQVGSVPRDASFDTPALLAERLAAIRANRALPADPRSDEIWISRFLAGSRIIGDARTAISAKATHWSPASYEVCFAGEKADPGELSGLEPFGTTGLFGPVLLPTCSDATGAPCVDQRTATGEGGVELVIRIPAEDPWMR